jgi:hypothetical protein
MVEEHDRFAEFAHRIRNSSRRSERIEFQVCLWVKVVRPAKPVCARLIPPQDRCTVFTDFDDSITLTDPVGGSAGVRFFLLEDIAPDIDYIYTVKDESSFIGSLKQKWPDNECCGWPAK